MKKVLTLFLTSMTLVLNGQDKGIDWIEGLNWEQVKELANNQHKFIFVDCYATWCGPCKRMDNDVYISDTVGKFMNNNFISVKLQMDSTENDSGIVRQWRTHVRYLKTKYKIDGYPSFLFYSPEGKLVHLDKGYKDINDFLSLAQAATIPEKQFYHLLDEYASGNIADDKLAELAILLKKDGQAELANEVAKRYFENYLRFFDDTVILSTNNISFLQQFVTLLNSKDPVFRLLFENRDKIVNRKIDPSPIEWIIKYVIRKEELTDRLYRDNKPLTQNPNWRILRTSIRRKYGKVYGKTVVKEYKSPFYIHAGNWKKWAQLFERKLKAEKIDEGDAWTLNINAWTVFLYCPNRKILVKALKWIELAISLKKTDINVQYIDTKANLLYKLGHVKEAIEWEQKAIDVDKTMALKVGRKEGFFNNEYRETLLKMKFGKPTWEK